MTDEPKDAPDPAALAKWEADVSAGSPPSETAPSRIGQYEVKSRIGEGSTAVVYLGSRVDEGGTERLAALKVIKHELAFDGDYVKTFLDETRIAARLDHPNVVKVYEVGREGARLYIAMERLNGRSLLDVWKLGVGIGYEFAAYIGARIADALDYAHDLKGDDGAPLHLVHRDVSPGNVFITYEGDVKVIDFGLARANGRLMKTAAGTVKGQLGYMSPEQVLAKEPDRRSDIFALGVTLWELTTGRRLFGGESDIEILAAVREAKVPDPAGRVAGYPPELWKILKRCLARDPEDRYATAKEVSADLDAFSRRRKRSPSKVQVGHLMRTVFDADEQPSPAPTKGRGAEKYSPAMKALVVALAVVTIAFAVSILRSLVRL